MAVVSHPRLAARCNHFAAPELRVVFQGIAEQFLHLLRNQELIEDYALRPNPCGSFQHSNAAVGSRLAFSCFLTPDCARVRQSNAGSTWRLRPGAWGMRPRKV